MTSVAAPGTTRRLAEFASGISLEGLPDDVVHQARRLLLDTVGCILGGRGTRLGDRVLAWVAASGAPVGGRGARIIGGSPSGTGPGILPAHLAAYGNGRLAAVLDADETWPSARQTSHLAAAAVAAALAATEERGATSGELLAAIVAGYEVGARVSDALIPDAGASRGLRAGWGPGSILAATAAAARAGQLGAAETAHALGSAALHVGPAPLQWTEVRPAPMIKTADAGWHAMAAVCATAMASIGLTSYDAILDGERGLWRSLGYAGCDDDALVGEIGKRWRVLEAAFKRWPAQYWMQPALTALHAVVIDHAPQPDDIEAIVLETNEKSFSAKFRDPDPPGEVDRAFSFPHTAAMLVLGIPPGPRWVDGDTAGAAEVRRLRGLVRVALHPDAGRVDEWVAGHQYRDLPARATVVTSGGTLTAEVRAGAGAPWAEEARLSDADLVAKARELSESWARRGPDRVAHLEAAADWILRGAHDARVTTLTTILGASRDSADDPP